MFRNVNKKLNQMMKTTTFNTPQKTRGEPNLPRDFHSKNVSNRPPRHPHDTEESTRGDSGHNKHTLHPRPYVTRLLFITSRTYVHGRVLGERWRMRIIIVRCKWTHCWHEATRSPNRRCVRVCCARACVCVDVSIFDDIENSPVQVQRRRHKIM